MERKDFVELLNHIGACSESIDELLDHSGPLEDLYPDKVPLDYVYYLLQEVMPMTVCQQLSYRTQLRVTKLVGKWLYKDYEPYMFIEALQEAYDNSEEQEERFKIGMLLRFARSECINTMQSALVDILCMVGYKENEEVMAEVNEVILELAPIDVLRQYCELRLKVSKDRKAARGLEL
jgi:hypothetical protein